MKRNNSKEYEYLINNEFSVIKNFIDRKIPENDSEYLNLWFDYIYLIADNSKLISNLFSNISLPVDNIIDFYDLRINLTKTLKSNLDKKIAKLSFRPRLEKYLADFNLNERENLRLLILAYFYTMIIENNSFITLLGLGNRFNINSSFILNLSPSHKIFQDKLFEFNAEPLRSSKTSYYGRELYFRYPIYKIFANINLYDEDIAAISNCYLLEYFNIENSYNNNKIIKQPDEDTQVSEHVDFVNIETFIKEFPDKDESKSHENIDIQPVDGELKPYADDLEYLYNEFIWINELEDYVKNKSNSIHVKNLDDLNLFQKLQFIDKQKNICTIRLKKSIDAGFVPRLILLSNKLNLSEFEINVLKLLTCRKIFVWRDSNFLGSFELRIGDIITILIEDPIQRVYEEKKFLNDAKLVKYNLIHLDESTLNKNSFKNMEVSIDDRLVNYFIGEDFNISNFVDGSFLYRSNIKLENVILPDDTKQKILETIKNFPLFLQAKESLKFSEIIEYGNSLVILFVGSSGTGKTLLANAVSNYLGKKILLFNLNNSNQMNQVFENINIFQLFFREARINDAVLFFDEAEDLLSRRFNDLLIEIERHKGIIIFATNASFRIDEAMKRRINLILNFNDPGAYLRKKIWQVHLPEKIKLSKNVDLNTLSKRFELNGGLIKNAVFTALARAVNRSGSYNPTLKMEDLVYGAKEQIKNKLFMSKIENQKNPKKGFDSLVLPYKTMNLLNEIVETEKSQKVLIGEWGFNETFSGNIGNISLFHGPPGTGKTLAAEAIAFETGKSFFEVNYSNLFSKWVGDAEKAVEYLFKEVATSNCILLFNEADALFSVRTQVNNSSDKYSNLLTNVLLNLVENNDVFIILTTNFFDNIDPAFHRRFRFIVEFKKPTKQLRYKLWKKLLPPKFLVLKDVNLEKLAGNYEFTGGEIRKVIERVGVRVASKLEKNKRFARMNDFVEICDDLYKETSKVSKMGFK